MRLFVHIFTICIVDLLVNTREKRERERILCPFCLLSRALFLLALFQQEGS
jgi:hypothetical protein